MSALKTDIQRQVQLKIGPWISERTNSTPFYVVGADQPRVPVTLDSSSVGAQRHTKEMLVSLPPVPTPDDLMLRLAMIPLLTSDESFSLIGSPMATRFCTRA